MAAPEGTRSKTGQLAAELKKGVFHTQKEQNAVFQPIVVIGAYESWSPKMWFPAMSRIDVEMLPAIDAKPNEDMDDTRERVRLALCEAYARSVPKNRKVSGAFWLHHLGYYVPLWAVSQYAVFLMMVSTY